MRPRRVLLVEDEDALMNLIRMVLSSAGHEVLSATSGEEAVRLVDQTGFEPDLLLSDIELGEMRGDELARTMLGAYPDMKVLLMSGYGSEALNSTDYPVLSKPFMPKELLEAVNTTLDC